MSQGQRRLAAIMFTDMVGYTALGQRNEAISLALVEEQRRLLRPTIERHRGREVKTMGDAFLVEFPSALDAVRCAYDIQRSTREFNISLPAEQRIHLRVGVHVGDLVESGGDILGDSVNVASRIESLADDGGVCITRQVYDNVKGKFELPMESIGPKNLKNVSTRIEVFKFVMPWTEQGLGQAMEELDRYRLAILPFKSMSPNPDDEYFADGMTEELITTLSKVAGLTVIGRTSVMQYKNATKRISEISRDLSAGTLIEGSVRKAGNRVRITVQLLDSRTEGHLWAENYDKELDDIFAIQSDVASKVASSLSTGVFMPRRDDTNDFEAYTMYMKAVQLLHDGTEQNVKEAVRLLEKVTVRDPKFIRAQASLTRARTQLATYEDFVVEIGKAEVAGRRALELGPDYAEAHAAMAKVYSALDKFEASISEAKKAIEINPNLAEAYLALGECYLGTGMLAQSLEAFGKAHELDPLSYAAGQYLGIALFASGKREEALVAFEKLRELHPRNPRVYARLAACHMFRGDFTTAQEMLDIGRGISRDDTQLMAEQGVLFARRGKVKKAGDTLVEMMKSKSESRRLWGQLLIQSALGHLDEAFEALMRMAQTHSWPNPVKTWPLFEPLWKDPRFAEFCAKVGIPA